MARLSKKPDSSGDGAIAQTLSSKTKVVPAGDIEKSTAGSPTKTANQWRISGVMAAKSLSTLSQHEGLQLGNDDRADSLQISEAAMEPVPQDDDHGTSIEEQSVADDNIERIHNSEDDDEDDDEDEDEDRDDEKEDEEDRERPHFIDDEAAESSCDDEPESEEPVPGLEHIHLPAHQLDSRYSHNLDERGDACDDSDSQPSQSNLDEESDSDLSGFIVSDSASETELRRGTGQVRRPRPAPRSLSPLPQKTPRRLVRKAPAAAQRRRNVLLFGDDSDSEDEVRVKKPEDVQSKALERKRKSSVKPTASEIVVLDDSEDDAEAGEDEEEQKKNDMEALADQLATELRVNDGEQADDGEMAGIDAHADSQTIDTDKATQPASPVPDIFSDESIEQASVPTSPSKRPSPFKRPLFHPPTSSIMAKKLDLDRDTQDDTNTESRPILSPEITPSSDTSIPQTPKTTRKSTKPKTGTSTSTSTSPSKKPTLAQTPAQRREFLKVGRQEMAETFLAGLIARVPVSQHHNTTHSSSISSTGNPAPRTTVNDILAAEGTGEHPQVTLVWSKTLLKTAGRARSWIGRIPQTSVTANLGASQNQSQNNNRLVRAEIELSGKVLTAPASVYNTVAHEFCHVLAAAENPDAQRDRTLAAHGAEFRDAARRVERVVERHRDVLLFPITTTTQTPPSCDGAGPPHQRKWEREQLMEQLRNEVKIEITRCHSYEIEYRYLWACERCGREVGRHSKSLPPGARHKICGGAFAQIRPTPRKLGNSAVSGSGSGGGGAGGGGKSPGGAAAAAAGGGGAGDADIAGTTAADNDAGAGAKKKKGSGVKGQQQQQQQENGWQAFRRENYARVKAELERELERELVGGPPEMPCISANAAEVRATAARMATGMATGTTSPPTKKGRKVAMTQVTAALAAQWKVEKERRRKLQESAGNTIGGRGHDGGESRKGNGSMVDIVEIDDDEELDEEGDDAAAADDDAADGREEAIEQSREEKEKVSGWGATLAKGLLSLSLR